jgi:hypothetical protein
VTITLNTGETATTAADGTYSIANISNGTYIATPSLNGYIFNPTAKNINIVDSNIIDIDFTAEKVYTVSGIVTDENNNPVQGVTVSTDIAHSAVTALDGTYTISDLTNGNYKVIPQKDEYIFTPESIDITISDDKLQNINFIATRTYSVLGSVKDVSGKGIAGIKIYIDSIHKTVTSKEGGFKISGLTNGTYELKPLDDNYLFTPEKIEITINNANLNDLNFTGIHVYTVSGRIVTNEGIGLENVTVDLGGQSKAQTGADGYYQISNIIDGKYIVTPNLSGYWFEPEFIEIEVKDSDVNNINFTGSLNFIPIANDDLYSINVNQVLTITTNYGIYSNDIDFDGKRSDLVILDSVQHGTLNLAPDGGFTYTPESGFIGIDSFTYYINDGMADSNTAIVKINILPLDEKHAPLAVNDKFFKVNTGKELPISAPGVLANDSDDDGDALTTVIERQPIYGAVILNPDGSFIYTPPKDFVGTDAFTYRANDGILNSNIALVEIEVTSSGIENPAIALDDQYDIIVGIELNVPAPGVMLNDYYDGTGILTVELTEKPTEGILSLGKDGGFTYTSDKIGTIKFKYRIFDETSYSNTATVTIHVKPVPNTPPIAVDDAYRIEKYQILKIPPFGVLSNDYDPDGDALTSELSSLPKHGELTFHSDGSFTYIPEENFDGIDSFTYYAFDGKDKSNTATVYITVAYVKVTIGTPVFVNIADVKNLPANTYFSKPPKIYGIFKSGKKANLKRAKRFFSPMCALGYWKKRYRLYDKKAVKKQGYANTINGTYQEQEVQLHIKAHINNYEKIDNKANIILLVPPEIYKIKIEGNNIIISGKFFGTKRPKVILEPELDGKLIKCKVNRHTYYFDPETGDSEVTASYRPEKVQQGKYWVVIDNKIGIGITEDKHGEPILPQIQIK